MKDQNNNDKGMNKELIKVLRIIARSCTALLLTAVILAGIIMTSTDISRAEGEDNDGTKGGKKDITIEVVEDIPADDIEEAELPLAAFPDSPASNGVRHMGMMLILLAGTAVYAIYFINYEKKLVALREQAAAAEAEALKARKHRKE